MALLTILASVGWAADDPIDLPGDTASIDEATSAGTQSAPTEPSISSPPAPIGVRLAEALAAHQLRLAYSFERVRHQGLQVGGSDRSQTEVLAGIYRQAPTDLDITVHEIQLAFAPHDRVTLVVEVPFLEKELRRIDVDTGRFQDQTDGIGDIAFAIVVPFIRKGHESSQVHVGVKAPTGSIRRGGDEVRLPYDLQLGNGTWDLEWGWTYRGEWDWLGWGAAVNGHHPVGTNGLHYREGSRFDASLWSMARIFGGLSASLRLSAHKQNNIRGRDRSLDLELQGPSANDKARGGFRVEVHPGMTLEIPRLHHQRLSFEFGLPIHQDLDGPQLAREWSLKAGWQWVF